MSRKASSVLALLAVAAAIECPDETWLKMNGKCYSKQASGTHAECATLCGANSSLIHITSKLENDFASFVAGGKPAWLGFYKFMHPLHPHDPGMWGRWTSSEEIAESGFTNWAMNEPNDVCGAQNCATINANGQWRDVMCAWPPEYEDIGGPQPACLCEYPAVTTNDYLQAVPLLEEPCQDDENSALRNSHAILACALLLIEMVRALRRDREISQDYAIHPSHRSAAHIPSDDSAIRDEGNDQQEPVMLAGGRRMTRISEIHHLKRLELEDKGSSDDIVESLRIKNLGIALIIAGLRAPSCVKGARVKQLVPILARVGVTWAWLSIAAFYWVMDDTALGSLATAFGLCSAVTIWFVHATLHSIVDNPAHLHFVVEPLKRDPMVWKQLQDSLIPKLLLTVIALIVLVSGVVFHRVFAYGGVAFGYAVMLIGISLTWAGLVVFVTFTRLLSAGHARLLVNLERHIAQLLHDTSEDDSLGFCSAVHANEDKLAGAMAVPEYVTNQ